LSSSLINWYFGIAIIAPQFFSFSFFDFTTNTKKIVAFR